MSPGNISTALHRETLPALKAEVLFRALLAAEAQLFCRLVGNITVPELSEKLRTSL